MFILGNKVRLRAVELSDLEILKAAINSNELETFESGFSFPVSDEAQKKWISENTFSSNAGVKLIVEFNGEAVGYTNILDIDWKNRIAWNGIKIFSKKSRGQGLGMDAVMAVMRFCFSELNLNRLEGKILTYNKPSYRLYVEKCGWKVEGIKRQSVFKNGEYHDEYYVSILKDEYFSLIEGNHYWA